MRRHWSRDIENCDRSGKKIGPGAVDGDHHEGRWTELIRRGWQDREGQDSQATGIDGEIVGEYYAPHTGFARTTLAHEQDFSLLGLLHLGSRASHRGRGCHHVCGGAAMGSVHREVEKGDAEVL